MSPTKCLLVVFLAWCSFVGVALGAESADGDLSEIGDIEAVESVVEAVEDLAIAEAVEDLAIAEAVEPVDDAAETVVEAVEPVVEAAEPVVEATEQVVEAAEPVVEAVEPVVEAVEPVVEAVEPVVEAVEPVVEAVEPVVEAVEPQVVATKVVEPEDDEAEVLMATLNKKFVQNKALLAELEEKKEQIGKIESLNELLRKQLEVKFSEATQLQNEIDEVTAQYGTHMQSSAAAIKDKDEKIQATASIAAASHNKMVELQEEMRTTETNLANVQNNLERQTQLVQTLEDQRATLEQQRVTQNKEINMLKSEKDNLKSLHSEALEQVQSTRGKLEIEAKRTADQKVELSDLLHSTDSKVKVFQADLDSSRSEKIALKESLGAAKREADALREKIKSQDELRIVNDDLVEINKHLKVSKLTLQESVDGLNNEVQLQKEEIEKTQQKFWIAIAGSVTCVVLSFCLRPSSKSSKTDFDTASNSRNFSVEKTSDSSPKSQKIITTNNSNNNSVTASGKKGKSKAKKA